MSIPIWILIGTLVYSFILVPVFMELALAKSKKTKDNKLCIKSDGFVIRFLYGVNAYRERKQEHFPKNTCQLYKGIYGGVFFFFFFLPFCSFLIGFFYLILFGFVGPFAFIAGYMPNPVGFSKNKRYEEPFYPYEERRGGKTWIAPWKFVLPISLVALICFFHREIFASLIKISHTLSSTTAMIVYSGITGLFFLVIIINKIRKKESFVAMKEMIISFIKKMCKEIEIT